MVPQAAVLVISDDDQHVRPLWALLEVAHHVGDVLITSLVRRGEAYFREIEAWPSLSDGRNALTVAKERCRRTTTAFP
jgi:hypothetical protein